MDLTLFVYVLLVFLGFGIATLLGVASSPFALIIGILPALTW